MRETIMTEIKDLKEKHNVEILFAVESGSRGWGFESSDSDYDVRFVYAHKEDWYLQVFDGKDIIDLPVDEVLDINGWDIRKALQLMYKSNAPLFEWITSPIVYEEVEGVRERMLELANNYFSPISCTHHYINLARKSLSDMDSNKVIRIKKLFYAIRPVFACTWIEKYNTIPPMNLFELMDGIDVENDVSEMIKQLVKHKKTCTEADTINLSKKLYDYIVGSLDHFEERVKLIKHEKNKDVNALDSFLIECINR